MCFIALKKVVPATKGARDGCSRKASFSTAEVLEDAVRVQRDVTPTGYVFTNHRSETTLPRLAVAWHGNDRMPSAATPCGLFNDEFLLARDTYSSFVTPLRLLRRSRNVANKLAIEISIGRSRKRHFIRFIYSFYRTEGNTSTRSMRVQISRFVNENRSDLNCVAI